MADSCAQEIESSKECMTKINKIIDGALGTERSESDSKILLNAVGDKIGTSVLNESLSSLGSLDTSKMMPNRADDSYKSLSGDHSSCISSSTLTGYSSSKSPTKRLDFEESKYSMTKDSSLIDSTKDTPNTAWMPTSSDDWVNYQFNRLVTDRKNSPRTSSSSFINDGNLCSTPQPLKMKNVKDIIREYSSGSLSEIASSNSVLPQTCRMSSFKNNLLKTGWMNKSHNNETLQSSNSELESMRRVESSVDGDMGDMMKSFGTKCSLSNTRCRTPTMSSGTQLYGTEEKKSPNGVPSDSEVDFKPACETPGETRNDLSILNYSFRKERERLRNLDTLIRKAPVGPEFAQSLRTRNYSSRFLNEYSGRKAFSATDYTTYSNPDWNATTSSVDIVGRAMSSMSYKNVGLYPMPSTKTNYNSEYITPQYLSPSSGTGRLPSRLTFTEESETPCQSTYNYQSPYPKTGGESSSKILQRSKPIINRSYNAKKERNPPKAQSENQPPRQKNSFTKSSSTKSSNIGMRRSFDHQCNRKEQQNSTIKSDRSQNRLAYPNYKLDRSQNGFASSTFKSDRSQNRLVSPDLSSSVEMHRRESQLQNKTSKYQPYKPYITQLGTSYSPKQTKSEMSSNNGAVWAEQLDYTEPCVAESDSWRNHASSAPRPTDSEPCLQRKTRNSETWRESGHAHRTVGNFKGRKQPRSKSECRTLNFNQILPTPNQYPQSVRNKMNISQIQRPLRAKKIAHKPKLKAKKTIPKKRKITKR